MSTARDLGLDPNVVPPALPPVTLRSGNPMRIVTDCRAVARKAGWTLARWDEFYATCKACFTPSASAEEAAKLLDVVASHFTVTFGPGFRWDPSEWDHRQADAEPLDD